MGVPSCEPNPDFDFGPQSHCGSLNGLIKSNLNFAELNLDELNLLLDDLEAAELPADTARISQAIEALVMSEAVYLPYAVDRIVLYRPESLTDIYVQIALGNQYDLVNIGKQENLQ